MWRCLTSGVAIICLVMAVTVTGCNDATERLKSPDKNVVSQAIHEIAGWDTEAAVTILTDFAKTQPDVLLACRAVQALGMMKRPEGLKAVCEFVKSDKRAVIRQAALTEVGRHRDPSYGKTLFEPLAANDPDPNVRAAAISGIFQLNRLADVPTLLALAEKEEDVSPQARAVGAVEKLVQSQWGYNPAGTAEERQKFIMKMKYGDPALNIGSAIEMAEALQRQRDKDKMAKGK